MTCGISTASITGTTECTTVAQIIVHLAALGGTVDATVDPVVTIAATVTLHRHGTVSAVAMRVTKTGTLYPRQGTVNTVVMRVTKTATLTLHPRQGTVTAVVLTITMTAGTTRQSGNTHPVQSANQVVITATGPSTVGTNAGRQGRGREGRTFGAPDVTRHATLAKQ